jgi:hypothetical protein
VFGRRVRLNGPHEAVPLPFMATRFAQIVFDSRDPAALAHWWGQALGWEITLEEPDEVEIGPVAPVGAGADASVDASDPDTAGVPLVFVPVSDPKAAKNRVHLDLRSPDEEEHSALVDRLVELGARPVDIGQGDLPWVVLADPEGNELCVLEPRDEYADTGPLAAIVVDAVDPSALGDFYSEATGWPVASRREGVVALRDPSGRGPFLELIRVDEGGVREPVKNRVHIDVAPRSGDDQAAEVDRLRGLGAALADVGQGEVTWVVLADPEDGEFCVLSPR